LLQTSNAHARFAHQLFGVSVWPFGLRVMRRYEGIGREGQAPGGVVPGVQFKGLFVLKGRDNQGKDHGETDKCSRK